MNRTVTAVLLLCAILSSSAVAAAAGADSWPQIGYDASATNFNSADRVLGVNAVRHFHAVWRRQGVVEAIEGDGRIFAFTRGGSSARLLFLDAASGAQLQALDASQIGLPRGEALTALALAPGRLIVAGTRATVALDPISARRIWRTGEGATSLAVWGNRIFTGQGCQAACGSAQSLALDAGSGRIIWRHPGNFGGPVVANGGLLYQAWGEMTGQTRVYKPDTGRIVARLAVFGAWTGNQNGNFIESIPPPGPGTSWLERLRPNGLPSWRLRIGRIEGAASTVLAGHTLFSTSNRFHPGVIAVDTASGAIRWGADLGANLTLAAANGLLYVLHDSSGRLEIVHLGNGQIVTRLQLRGGGSSEVMIAAGTLYVVSGGVLTALRA